MFILTLSIAKLIDADGENLDGSMFIFLRYFFKDLFILFGYKLNLSFKFF